MELQNSESSKQPGPGALTLVQAFVNTVDYDPQREDLDSPAQLGVWLAANGLLEQDAMLRDADLQRAQGVREALRALLLGNNGAPVATSAVEILNRVAASAPLVMRFDAAGHAQLEPTASGLDGALGRLLAVVYTAMTEGTWSRLKACRSETCQWAFYDQSKNRSGAWCSMATCGSRVKARAYRQRQRQETPAPHRHH